MRRRPSSIWYLAPAVLLAGCATHTLVHIQVVNPQPAVVVVCDAPDEPYGSKCLSANMQPEPVTISLSGDGTLAMDDIVWSHWGSGEAVGQGVYEWNNCVPSCAAGSPDVAAGSVILTGLVPYKGGEAYGNMTLVTPRGVEPAMGTHLQDLVP